MASEEDSWYIVYGFEDSMLLDFWKRIGTPVPFLAFKTQLEHAREQQVKKAWTFYDVFAFLYHTSAWFSTIWSVLSYRPYVRWLLKWYFGI